MEYKRHWGLPSNDELVIASRCIGLANSWFATLTPLLQAVAIPFLAAVLFFSR